MNGGCARAVRRRMFVPARKEDPVKTRKASPNRAPRRILKIACGAALAVAFTAVPPASARAEKVTPPPVPAEIAVPAGNRAYLEGHAVGTQNYICLQAGVGFSWTFIGPQATLFDDKAGQIITHFLSANPEEAGIARATWQHSRDTSSVWGQAIALSTDPAFVAPGSIPWLLLSAVGAHAGPTGGRKLTETTFIHRLNTAGGIAPATGCNTATDVGKRELVSYTADYFFYRAD